MEIAYTLGLLVFGLNGLIFIGQYNKMREFNFKAQRIEDIVKHVRVRRSK